jgi:hypothetical protein
MVKAGPATGDHSGLGQVLQLEPRMMPVVALIVLPFPVQMQRISSQSQLEKNFTSTLRRYTAVQQRTWADYLNLESNAAVAAVWYGHSQVACIKIVLCGSLNSVQLTTFLQVCDSVTFGGPDILGFCQADATKAFSTCGSRTSWCKYVEDGGISYLYHLTSVIRGYRHGVHQRGIC